GHRPLKIRSIQSHGQAVNEVSTGDRAALNVGNISTDEISRGEQLAAPGHVTESKTIGVEISLLPESPALPNNHPVRLNLGTAEVMGRVKLPGRAELKPGESAPAILDLAVPIPVLHGDALILRSFSPVTTIGGGRVVDVELPRQWKRQRDWVSHLVGLPESERVQEMIGAAGTRPLRLKALGARLGLVGRQLESRLTENIVRLGPGNNPWLLANNQLDNIIEQVEAALKEHHREHPYQKGANREFLRQRLDSDDKFMDVLAPELVDRKVIAVDGDIWHSPGFKVNLSAEDTALMDRLEQLAEAQRFDIDYLENWADELGTSSERIKLLARIGESRGSLVRVAPRLIVHRSYIDRLIAAVRDHFKDHRELTVADLKNMTGTSRKLAVPFLEYLDRKGITLRIGDKRVKPDG
ncbi:MAG: SelB C-terminal domain-containing protein, partial [Candidatus Marinimicrobia bacterium]|nr:SelB C-terminal domain-containing protein [Candidatus Neomarinimicrobiota bacterium]